MEVFYLIMGAVAGVFLGFTAGGYMLLKELANRDKTIEEQKKENLQVCNENKDLRAENEDLQIELSTVYKENELKDKQIECIRTVLEQNSYGRDDIKIAKLKELVANLEDNN